MTPELKAKLLSAITKVLHALIIAGCLNWGVVAIRNSIEMTPQNDFFELIGLSPGLSNVVYYLVFFAAICVVIKAVHAQMVSQGIRLPDRRRFSNVFRPLSPRRLFSRARR